MNNSVYIFIVVLQAIVAVALVGVILMQQSEGGGLGVGGNPSGLMSARGAASFMTRATAVLATIFVVLSITLAAIAATSSAGPVVPADLAVPASGAAPAAAGTTLPTVAAPSTRVASPTAAANPLDLLPAKQ
jgi:preprotein translocase subunit SecG